MGSSMSAVQGAHAAVHPATLAGMIASMVGAWQIVARTATTEAMAARGEYDRCAFGPFRDTPPAKCF